MFYDRNTESVYFTATERREGIPTRTPIPSPESVLVLPGDPNPFNKPGLIPIFQYISNIYQQYLNDKVNVGYLQTQVTTGAGATPVSGAKVTISKPIGHNLFMSQMSFTDERGMTPPVTLPTRSVELSETSEYPVPYTIWNLIIESPGYFDVIVYDIPIFPNITSTQYIDLIPSTIISTPKEIYASKVSADVY